MTTPDLADPSTHLASIWQALQAATAVVGAAWRTPVLSTIALDGSVDARTLVLRSANADARELNFFADARGPKVQQLSLDPRASLVFWDPASQVQLRVSGECSRLSDVAKVRDAWQNVPESNRHNYRTLLSPGSPIESPLAEKHRGGDGFKNFAVLIFAARTSDWLWLDRAGHKRCQFDLTVTPATRQWLVP